MFILLTSSVSPSSPSTLGRSFCIGMFIVVGFAFVVVVAVVASVVPLLVGSVASFVAALGVGGPV